MTIFVFCIIYIIGQALTIFFTNFFSQKGKNTADKQDIQKLTSLSEEIKSKFQIDNEYLKSSLTILTDRKTKTYTQEQQSIINFYSEVQVWIYHKLLLEITIFNTTNIENLNTAIDEINYTWQQVNVYNGIMDLIVNDKELTTYAHTLILEVLKMHNFVIMRLKSVKWELNTLKYSDPSTSLESLNKMSDTMRDILSKRIIKAENDLKSLTEKFAEERLEYYKTALTTMHKFKNLAKTYLTKSL